MLKYKRLDMQTLLKMKESVWIDSLVNIVDEMFIS